MTINQNKILPYTFLLIGLLLSPFLSFSQQEEPKRVTIVVTAKEVKPQSEIVQLPADNAPNSVTSNYKKSKENSSFKAKKNLAIDEAPTTFKPAAKEKTSATLTPKIIKASTAKPAEIVKNSPIAPKKNEVAAAKPTVKQAQPERPIKEKNTAPTTNKSSTEVNVSKEVKQVGDEVATTIKLEAGDKEVAKLTHSSKVNSISYIWIGIFLIVAGVVLGLLFGKPAFLISFVGVVFITLGIII